MTDLSLTLHTAKDRACAVYLARWGYGHCDDDDAYGTGECDLPIGHITITATRKSVQRNHGAKRRWAFEFYIDDRRVSEASVWRSIRDAASSPPTTRTGRRPSRARQAAILLWLEGKRHDAIVALFHDWNWRHPSAHSIIVDGRVLEGTGRSGINTPHKGGR